MIKYNITFSKKYKDNLLLLFFDLLQISQRILDITYKEDIIILIGYTPSYLEIFLEGKRQYYILPFSNKPFGCFFPPNTFENPLDITCTSKKIYTPTYKQLIKYFTYLNKKTFLTKEFMKQKWNKIVLVDTSSGQSIHGVSIFFNLYIGNITVKEDTICNLSIDCSYIEGAKPIQFINLMATNIKSFNLKPTIAHKIFNDINKNDYKINFNPKLIIQIGTIDFYYRELFIIYDSFPRIVPFFHIDIWNNDPQLIEDKNYINIKKKYKYILENIDNINKNIKKKEKEKKCLKLIKNMAVPVKGIHKYISNNLSNTLYELNTIMLTNKMCYSR